MNPEWIGYVATGLSVSCQLPQILKVMREKHTTSLSLATYCLSTGAAILWICYGITIDSPSITLANGIVLLLGIIILYFKLKHG